MHRANTALRADTELLGIATTARASAATAHQPCTSLLDRHLVNPEPPHDEYV
jgi:hypothetical protein